MVLISLGIEGSANKIGVGKFLNLETLHFNFFNQVSLIARAKSFLTLVKPSSLLPEPVFSPEKQLNITESTLMKL